MPLGLFACRHAAAAADGGVWTPVLRLGGSRPLASIARSAAGAHRSSRSETGRKSTHSSRSGRGAAAAGLSPPWGRHCSSCSESESVELCAAADTASEEEEEEGRCCRRGPFKRARHVAAENSVASMQRDCGWHHCKEPSRGVWDGRSEDVVRCRFSPNGSFLATCTSSGALRVYEVETGQRICNIPYAHAGGINDICWHHSSGYVFTASSDGSAALFPLTFRPAGGAARRLLRRSGEAAYSSSAQLPLHVETAVAPVLEFFPRVAAAGASTAGTPFAAAGAGRGGGGTAGSGGSTLSAAASARHRSFNSSSGGLAVAPVTCVAAPQNSSAASSAHCMYTGSYDEFLRSWDMRVTRGPLLQVRAHDGPVTSLDFIEASPLLLPPYIPSRTAFFSHDSLSPLISRTNNVSCCCCATSSSPCRCSSSRCGYDLAACGSCCCYSSSSSDRDHRSGGGEEGLACAAAETAVASAAAALRGSRSGRRAPYSSAAAAAAAVSLPDMLASASVDGLVRLWQAPALKLLRTTRSGRGGWEGGSSGATAASPSAAAATVGRSGSSSVGCGSPAVAAAVATAGCCHVTWSRSGNFLLCLYEQGLGGGTVLRLHTLQQPRLERRLPRRQQLPKNQQRERQGGHRGKRSRSEGERDGRLAAGTGGEGQRSQRLDGLAEESEEEEDIAAEEEKWWGQETCMPLPVPFMWDEAVQHELLQGAFDASWHPAPSRHGPLSPAAGRRPKAAAAASSACCPGEGDHQAASAAARLRDDDSSCSGSGPHESGKGGTAGVGSPAACAAPDATACRCAAVAGVAQGGAAAAHAASRSSVAPWPFWTAPAASWRSDGAAALHELLCRKEKIFSPYGTFWRDCAVLPGSDGCVRVFDALRGKLLHTLVPAAEVSSSSSRSAVCTSVDAHPDWSVGVLASSCSAPDGAVVLWLWDWDEEVWKGD